ncbi:hypothetical protein IWQ60_001232 [Tieghemiomyces parasiticus]|uniref:Uncharacterized protein n=1 Tax=Tieghemiomyces parasiticus TaxID=78921 RepID=A0A9W8AH24_9FUNG|nr:hypothetical protein IWQ60_001232 [Tieghemiomyces parasiticus]
MTTRPFDLDGLCPTWRRFPALPITVYDDDALVLPLTSDEPPENSDQAKVAAGRDSDEAIGGLGIQSATVDRPGAPSTTNILFTWVATSTAAPRALITHRSQYFSQTLTFAQVWSVVCQVDHRTRVSLARHSTPTSEAWAHVQLGLVPTDSIPHRPKSPSRPSNQTDQLEEEPATTPPPMANPTEWVQWLTKFIRRGTELFDELTTAVAVTSPTPAATVDNHPDAAVHHHHHSNLTALKATVAQALDLAAETIANLCGKTAAGPTTKCFRLATRTPSPTSILLREPSFAQVDLGYKTWGAAFLLAELVARREVPVHHRRVLEIGAGTGLVGLACAVMGAKYLCTTDYLRPIVDNLTHNLELNGCEKQVARAATLDWSWFDSSEQSGVTGLATKGGGITTTTTTTTTDNSDDDGDNGAGSSARLQIQNRKFDMVVAADIIYELDHAPWLASLIRHYLQPDAEMPFSTAAIATHTGGATESAKGILDGCKSFVIVSPLRASHTREMEAWTAAMLDHGLTPVVSLEFDNPGHDDAAPLYRFQVWQLAEAL